MLRPLSVFFLLLACLVINSCRKDDLLTDSSARLEFSESTVMFDTVFVTVGSATQIFTVRNNNDSPVKISTVRLVTGGASHFRLNVNGMPGRSFTDVEIGANDSIYIFAEVTVPDPNSSLTPFILTDSILFELNGNAQYVNLVAWGQRAHFHHAPPNKIPIFYLTPNDVWTNDLPHVVYGYALVDSGALTIQQGTNIHFHPSSGIIVLTGGKMLVNGTVNSPVTFQGDRLGDVFKDIPGQWDKIWLSRIDRIDLNSNPIRIFGGDGPSGNVFNYAIIKNSFIGLQSDTVAVEHQPAAILNNTIIKNCASAGLFGGGTNIQANNCVFANCGEYCAALVYGGDYRFLHCTFANYWGNGNRQTPLLYLQNYYFGVRRLDSAYFGNCILFGNLDLEIGLDSSAFGSAGDFNYVFDHTLLKVDGSFSTSSPGNYRNIIRGADPHFIDYEENDFRLKSNSIAVDAGSITITNLSPVLNLDLKGETRPAVGTTPDMGAYERQ